MRVHTERVGQPPARDKGRKESQVGISEQLFLLCLTLVLAFVVGRVGASDKWLTTIFCTVPTFAGMISYFRKRMPSKVLWATMTVAFLFHLVLLWLVFGVLLRSRDDIGLLACLPGIFVEAFLLYHLVGLIERKLTGVVPRQNSIRGQNGPGE